MLPMAPLRRCIGRTWELLRVGALHLIIEGVGVVRIVSVGGKVHQNPSFAFAEEESDE